MGHRVGIVVNHGAPSGFFPSESASTILYRSFPHNFRTVPLETGSGPNACFLSSGRPPRHTAPSGAKYAGWFSRCVMSFRPSRETAVFCYAKVRRKLCQAECGLSQLTRVKVSSTFSKVVGFLGATPLSRRRPKHRPQKRAPGKNFLKPGGESAIMDASYILNATKENRAR